MQIVSVSSFFFFSGFCHFCHTEIFCHHHQPRNDEGDDIYIDVLDKYYGFHWKCRTNCPLQIRDQLRKCSQKVCTSSGTNGTLLFCAGANFALSKWHNIEFALGVFTNKSTEGLKNWRKPLFDLDCTCSLAAAELVRCQTASCISSGFTSCSKFGQIRTICGVLINGCWQLFCPAALLFIFFFPRSVHSDLI